MSTQPHTTRPALPLYYIVARGTGYQPTNYHTERAGILPRPYAGVLLRDNPAEEYAVLAPAPGHRYGTAIYGFLGSIIVHREALRPLYH